MYFVSPAANPGDEPESGEDQAGAREFVVWVADLRDHKPIRKIEIPGTQTNLPTILLSRDGKQLLMSYRDDARKAKIVDTFDTASFAKTGTVRDNSSNVINTYFPTEAYFAPSGKSIVEGNVRIDLAPGGFRQGTVDPRAKLTTDDKKKLSDFYTTGRDGQKLIVVGSVSSVDGRSLQMAVNEAKTESAFWVVDAETGTTTPPITVNYLAKAVLLGDGEQFGLFEGKFPPPNAQAVNQMSATGKMAIYNVRSGSQVSEFNIEGIKGAGGVLCTNAEGIVAAYGRGEELLLLDLRRGGVTRISGEFGDLPQPGYSGACAFGE